MDLLSVPPTAAERVLSVDVECVATGPGHNDRAVSSVAVVDGNGKTLLATSVQVRANEEERGRREERERNTHSDVLLSLRGNFIRASFFCPCFR